MFTYGVSVRAPELCESRGGRPGLPVPNKPTVSVDVKQHFNQLQPRVSVTAQELCESRGGRPGLPVPNSPYGLSGREATLQDGRYGLFRARKCVKVEVAVLCPRP